MVMLPWVLIVPWICVKRNIHLGRIFMRMNLWGG